MSAYGASAKLLAAMAELPGDRWVVDRMSDGTMGVAIHSDAGVTWLRLLHDCDAAPIADVEFVAASRSDVGILLRYLQLDDLPDVARLHQIRERIEITTSGEWECFLEAEGGLGGSNVITMSGSEADLYLSIDDRLAPDPVWVFVALAHREIRAMIAAIELDTGDL